jgi:hypothetical protein
LGKTFHRVAIRIKDAGNCLIKLTHYLGLQGAVKDGAARKANHPPVRFEVLASIRFIEKSSLQIKTAKLMPHCFGAHAMLFSSIDVRPIILNRKTLSLNKDTLPQQCVFLCTPARFYDISLTPPSRLIKLTTHLVLQEEK